MAAQPRASFICSSCLRSLQAQPARRAFSSRQPAVDPQFPRWKQTPPQMKQPLRLRPVQKSSWRVNNEQEPLDAMYDNLLSQLEIEGARKGREILPEEIKWLAVTHKSYDHGRQGFNDKLAYFGKRIVQLETSLALKRAPASPVNFARGKEVYQHPALDGVENVSEVAREQLLDRVRLSTLATKYGLDRVVRWKPRNPEAMVASGSQTILAHTMYSIVGALAMHRGGEVASRLVREKILRPLGLH